MLKASLLTLLAAPLALVFGASDSSTAAHVQDSVPEGMARFEVLDAFGKPADSAEIYMIEEENATEWNLVQHGIIDQDWETKVALLGRTVRTRSDGTIDVPLWSDGMLVLAHRNGSYFGRRVRAEPGPHQLPLRDQVPLRVRLTDPSGRPLVGAHVALRTNDGLEKIDLTTAPVSSLGGCANLFGAADFAEEVGAGYRITVSQVGVFRTVPEMVVDLEALPDEPIQLAGRPTGSLDVKLVGADGKPLVGNVEVSVRIRRDDQVPEVETPPVVRVTDTGSMTIPNIGLGLELLLEVGRPYSSNRTQIVIDGPNSPNEPLAHTIEYEERDVLLRGRVLGKDGEPLAGEYVNVYYEVGNFLLKGKGVQTVRTRESGYVQFPLVCRGRNAIQHAKVEFVYEVEDLHTRHAAAWNVDTVTEAQVIELGDIELE